jgi:4-hydroxybenzoate polyprenyltransferase
VTVLAAYVRACHPLPAVAVTTIIVVSGWALGWNGAALLGLAAAVGVGQLSVGWSNDAVDADLDARAGRTDKPTTSGAVSARGLWVAAGCALVVSVLLSWRVAGWAGGSWYVLWLAAAWVYNLRLSRTRWAWVPYAVAFGSVPALLTVGLGEGAPAAWMVVVFALVGVSAHLTNALPDLDRDERAGVGGTAVALGAARTAGLAWLLLALGSVILAGVVLAESAVLAAAVVAGLAAAWLVARRSRRRDAMFRGLLTAVALDLVVLIVALR